MARKAKTEKPTAAAEPVGSIEGLQGRSQRCLRNLNERVIMALIRRHGALAKSEIAAQSGLSAQAVTVIINNLESEGLLLRQAPQRGRVGQPSVPFVLNPAGAFAYGLKIGRRSYDLTLIDMAGNVQGSLHENCAYPTVSDLLLFVKKGLSVLIPAAGGATPARITGIGVAMPAELWNWTEELGAPASVLNQWRHFDLRVGIAEFSSLPVYLCNDDTAACAAELMFGNPGKFRSFLYIYLGSFVGGGVVIDGDLYPGRRGNAGAIGSMPVPVLLEDGRVGTRQLITRASIRVLEKMLVDAGINAKSVLSSYDYWDNAGPMLGLWVEQVAQSLAHAALSAISLIDFDAIIVDGHVPVPVRRNIVGRLRQVWGSADLRGLSPVEIVEGVVGARAQSIGSATLPFLVEFGENTNLTF